MILTIIHNIDTAKHLLQSASKLTLSLGKTMGVAVISDSQEDDLLRSKVLEEVDSIDFFEITNKSFSIEAFCQRTDASFLLVQPASTNRRTILKILESCRELRIPYMIFKDAMPAISLNKVLVPVNFLIEEIEKAQFASAFGRFCDSEITLLQAKDYGSRAKVNAERIGSVLKKFGLTYKIETGKKDSFKIEFDAVKKASEEDFGLIIASASREYGLDDVIFGPKELHLIKKSPVPVMLINPRGDLYTLCD